jgi:hypothetical protein
MDETATCIIGAPDVPAEHREELFVSPCVVDGVVLSKVQKRQGA